MLPIISVGSFNSVDYQEPSNPHTQLNSESENVSIDGGKPVETKRPRVGERLNRSNVHSLSKGLGMKSPSHQLSRPSMNQSVYPDRLSTN